MMAFVTVGLTGGIASGKTTVAQTFRALGVPIVDADVVAREVVAKGSEGLREIVVVFGPDVLHPDGSLDRKALGARIFANDEARQRLNAITHPRIAALSMAHMTEVAGEAPYVLYEAALIVENQLHRNLAALVVVAATEENQIARIGARDGLEEEAARARIAAQLPLADKVRVADYVIDNDGDKVATKRRVVEVHDALMARFGGQR